MRASGVLLPVASLPTKYGIGGFSKEAYTFVDQLKKAGQSYWQILPLGSVGFSGSPYQSFSAFAGNPYYISLETLTEEGLLTDEECERADCGADPTRVDYEALFSTRLRVLRKAFRRFYLNGPLPEDYNVFCEENREWLNDYCLFAVIKSRLGEKPWTEWPEELRKRDPKAMADQHAQFREEIGFYTFLQYEFRKQWDALKAYANANGIKIIGDIPIYVAMDSADAWAEPDLFQFAPDGTPLGVAGCPPDAFSETGQMWGNPLYDWNYHRQTGYAWWIRRMRSCAQLYDVVRIDHFRGFCDYFSIPYGQETAVGGHWEEGPKLELFARLREALGEKDYIAEDLGMLTDEVRQMVRDSGYPGMKILEFAFDSDDRNLYLPHHYEENSVVYTGTHDNNTLRGWIESLPEYTKSNLEAYIGKADPDNWDVIRLAMASVSKLCVIPIQDYMELGEDARINVPSTVSGNWCWRMENGQLKEETLEKMREMAARYSRLNG